MQHFSSVTEYVNNFEGKTKARGTEMRKLIQTLLPGAEERLSYNMPAYFLDSKLIIYFAGHTNHIGMYPGRTNSEAYNALAARYASGKSTARFLNDEPLPKNIIKQFIQTRLTEVVQASCYVSATEE